jgi:hypothetical protein
MWLNDDPLNTFMARLTYSDLLRRSDQSAPTFVSSLLLQLYTKTNLSFHVYPQLCSSTDTTSHVVNNIYINSNGKGRLWKVLSWHSYFE